MTPQLQHHPNLIGGVGCSGYCELICLPLIEDPLVYILCIVFCLEIWEDME